MLGKYALRLLLMVPVLPRVIKPIQKCIVLLTVQGGHLKFAISVAACDARWLLAPAVASVFAAAIVPMRVYVAKRRVAAGLFFVIRFFAVSHVTWPG